MNEYVVTARHLTKAFDGRTVVQGIDLDVPRGGCFGLLGPNGAGKTTTLRMILGQSPPMGGTLYVLGLPMPGAGREVRARIGVVPQADNLDPDFSVRENLEVYASYFGLNRHAVRRRIEELLELVELDDRADTSIRKLSGGMKRRLSIARALLNDPEILVLDEPTTGLDPQVRHLIWRRLRELATEGTTLLLTTHYMEEAERICDAIAIMDAGRIIAEGAPKDITRAHVEPTVVEIHGDLAPASELLGGLSVRPIEVGTSLYCYTDDPAPLLARLDSYPKLSHLQRAANLEDVFLRLTGHDLRE
jgi:lipooligosaccharide transport system ATP-binding protein